MKVCIKCKTPKDKSEYSKCRPNADGLQHNCKECCKIAAKLYSRTKQGFIVKTHQNQKHSSARRGHPMPDYTRAELGKWLFDQEEFHTLFKAWEDSGYERDLAPSLDRKDEEIHYTLSNIVLMPWYVNNQRQYDERYLDLKKTKQSKAVQAFTRDGEFIAEYVSCMAASRATGFNPQTISRIAKGRLLPQDKCNWVYI